MAENEENKSLLLEILKKISDLEKTMLDSVKEQQNTNKKEHDELRQVMEDLIGQVNQLELPRSKLEASEEDTTSNNSLSSDFSESTVKARSSDWSVYQPENPDLLHRKQRKTIEDLEIQISELRAELSAYQSDVTDYSRQLHRETQKNRRLTSEIHRLTQGSTTYDGDPRTRGQHDLRFIENSQPNDRRPRSQERRRQKNKSRSRSTAVDREFSFNDIRNNFN